MSWVTAIWSMVIAACVTLAVIHGFVWVRQRDSWSSLLFTALALATAGIAACEVLMMQAVSTAGFAAVLRWFHLPVWVALLSIIGFVHVYLRSDRLWLGLLAAALRTVSLLYNFAGPSTLNYRAIHALHPIPLLGEEVAIPAGSPNPWMAFGQASLLVLMIYLADASWTAWRRGDRLRAWSVGGMLFFFNLSGFVQAVLVYWGYLQLPVMASPFFLGTLVTMGFALSQELLKANQLAKDLQREKALTEAVFDGAPGLIYLYDQQGRLIRWNKLHEEITGYSSAELAGKSMPDWFDQDELARVKAAWHQVFTAGSARMECNLIIKGGQKIPTLLSGVKLEIDGQPYLVGVGLDLTEQKRMEAELREQGRVLTHMNRASTLGVLAGSIAHEVNQPLAIILSNAQAARRLLERQPPDLAEVRDILKDIVDADRRAGDVIKRLRAMLQRGEAHLQPTDLNKVVDEVLQLMGNDLSSRGVTVSRQLAEHLPLVSADRIPMQQVLLNLILNACDAMAGNLPGERQVTVATRREGGDVQLTIADLGSGLPADTSRLFEPFFTTKSAGLGMGLAICHAIVQAHRGRLWAEPNVARGAVFHVAVPVPEAVS